MKLIKSTCYVATRILITGTIGFVYLSLLGAFVDEKIFPLFSMRHMFGGALVSLIVVFGITVVLAVDAGVETILKNIDI